MTTGRTVALLMWGDLFEDFFDPLGIGFQKFRTELTGGWLFGYVDALATADVTTVLIFCSARVRRTQRFVHDPTGAAVVVLPAPARHRLVRLIKRALPRRKSLTSLASYLSLPLVRVAWEWRRQGVEAVIVQEYEHPRFDVCVGLGRLCRLRVVATFQGGDAPGSRLEHPVRHRTVRASHGVIIASASERERFHRAYGLPSSAIAAIPNAMDVARFAGPSQSDARAFLGIPATQVVVEWHGRVAIHRKGLDVLLDAWDQVVAERPSVDLLLLLVGTGVDADRLRQRIDCSPAGRVRWRDEYVTDRAELAPYLAAANLYVLPSRHEGFPVAVLEAMVAGLPVVAARAPGVADIFPDGEESGGIVVPCDDRAQLAQALGELVDDAARRTAMGRRARGRAAQHYSLEAVGSQLRTFVFAE